MFYLPFELREIKRLTTPRGPDFRRAKSVSVNLGGNIITLRLPRHKPVHSGYDDPVHLTGEIDIYDRGLYMEQNPIGPWSWGIVLHRSWRFIGPMFSGILADIPFALSIYRRRMRDQESLFDPEVFEREVVDRLAVRYSDKKSYWASDWIAPINWQLHHQLPVFAVSYDIVPKIADSPAKEFIFPISNDCMAVLHFEQHQRMDGRLEKKDQLIDRTPMIQLCQDIIDSVQLELSTESQQQLRWAQQQNPNATLNPHLKPLKWTTQEEDEKHAYYLAHPDEF